MKFKGLVTIVIIFFVVLVFIMTGGFGLEYFKKVISRHLNNKYTGYKITAIMRLNKVKKEIVKLFIATVRTNYLHLLDMLKN